MANRGIHHFGNRGDGTATRRGELGAEQIVLYAAYDQHLEQRVPEPDAQDGPPDRDEPEPRVEPPQATLRT